MNRPPACLVCPIEMGNKESYWSGLNGARKDYIAPGPVPALDGPGPGRHCQGPSAHALVCPRIPGVTVISFWKPFGILV